MKIEGDVIITKNCQFVLMNPFPPEPSPFNDPIRKESARIRRIIRTGGAPIDLTSGTVRASLKHPTRPFTPAPFSRGDPLLPAGNLPELLPSIEGLRLSRHRLLVPAKQHVLPRRLEPLLDKSESVISESASEVSTHRSVPSGLHPQLHHSPSQAQPNRADTKNSNNNEMAGAIKTLRALVSTFPDKIKSSARGDTIDSLLAQTQTTFHDARNLLISLSWLRHSNSTSPLNLVVSKTAEKETRDHIVEGLMKWMQVAEAAAATFPIELEVEIAIGVCSLILRITRDDRVLQNAFKLCFKLSKTDRNDAAFVRYRVYEAIVLYLGHLAADSARLSMSHKCEMAIYAVATLKNLANCEDAVACSDGAVTVLGRIMAVALNVSFCL
ncbi:hypothetical protein BC830DRAFT_869455 [Chytriomyces sp. MP71]|nr:hypothetical protein BC830DRAFT_869455 [Chytriomyces sp. MP71]